MVVDIQNIDSGNPILNGSAVIGQNGLGNFTSFVANSGLTIAAIKQPTISEITIKYDSKFDDVSFYVS